MSTKIKIILNKQLSRELNKLSKEALVLEPRLHKKNIIVTNAQNKNKYYKAIVTFTLKK